MLVFNFLTITMTLILEDFDLSAFCYSHSLNHTA